MSPSNGSAMVVVPLAAIAPAIIHPAADAAQPEGAAVAAAAGHPPVPVIVPGGLPGSLAEQPVVHVRCGTAGVRWWHACS